MKKSQVRDLIYTGLTPVVSDKGFRLKKRAEGFIRPIPRGWQCIGVPFWDYNPKFEFSLVMTVRLDEVQDIINKFSGSPPEYHSGTSTTTFRLEFFVPKENTIFKVTSESEIQAAISKLIPVIQNRIIPFLDEHQDLKSIAAAMNLTEIKKIVPGAANAMGPVTVARLISSPDFHSIVGGYTERLSRLPKIELERFQKLVQYLEKL